jgi:hypothetical protein
MALTQTRECIVQPIASPTLTAILREQFGDAGAVFTVLPRDPLGDHVYRVRLEADGRAQSVVVKRLKQAVARRVELVARRWLPAVGLEHAGPPLLAAAAEPDGRHVWHLYHDLGDCILDERAPDATGVVATIELMAQLHLRFADHTVLGECRQWCGDVGMGFYRNSVREAMRALDGFEPPLVGLKVDLLAVRDRILTHLNRLLAEEAWRAPVMAEFGGPETLLHGDLWPKNTIVYSAPAGICVRFIDWDRVSVGPVTYDLSTFIYRLPRGERGWVVDRYRQALAAAGWQLPSSRELDVLFTTAEFARLANCAIWPLLAAMQEEADWQWALETLVALDEWFNAARDRDVHA